MKKGVTFTRKAFSEKEITDMIKLFDEGKKHKEIAKVLGRTEKSVSSKLEALTRKRMERWTEKEKKDIKKSNRSRTAQKVKRFRMKKEKEKIG